MYDPAVSITLGTVSAPLLPMRSVERCKLPIGSRWSMQSPKVVDAPLSPETINTVYLDHYEREEVMSPANESKDNDRQHGGGNLTKVIEGWDFPWVYPTGDLSHLFPRSWRLCKIGSVIFVASS